MAMEEKEYLEYLKLFTETKKDPLRCIPKFRGVKDFDFVDETSQENKVVGHASKWCIRISKMYFKDLIEEVKRNDSTSFQTCYTNKEIKENQIPEYFSVLIKVPDRDMDLDADVFASRVLNYFELPVVFNRRIDKALPHFSTSKYLVSVDFLRPNEKFVPLNEIVEFGRKIDLKRIDNDGIKNTARAILAYLENYLKQNDISFTEKNLKEFEDFLVYSLAVRVILLGDDDYRNGNVGILVNDKTKTFRPAPNFDMEMSFIYRYCSLKLSRLLS